MSIRIERCICFDKPFAELAEIARLHHVHTIPELQAHVNFGFKCRLCRPYVARMLKTGETVFSELLTEES